MVAVAFASSNPGKVAEVRRVLAKYGVATRWLRRSLSEVQSSELREVALHKLGQLARGSGYVLVEDSGLFVPSLGGFPGVYSAHVLEIWGFEPLLELLRRRDRRAAFRTVAALGLGRRRWTFVGEVTGTIARRPRGSHGFGYDPIFVPDGYRRTFGELPAETKDRISHRAKAIAQVGEFVASRAARSGSR